MNEILTKIVQTFIDPITIDVFFLLRKVLKDILVPTETYY